MTAPPQSGTGTAATAAASVPTSQVVAVCQGRRCQALLMGHHPDAMEVLREATRHSRHGLLVSTDCAGPCSHAPVVVVGTGVSPSGRLEIRTDAVLGPVGPAEVRLLAAYLLEASTARLPASLEQVRLDVR